MRTVRTIRHRLALLLALPTGALVVLAALGTAGQATRFTAAGRTDDQVALTVATQELVHQLQRERGLTAGLLGGDESFRAQLGGGRAAADQARRALDQRLAAGPPGAAAVRSALTGLGQLAALRGRADTGTATRAEALGFFTTAVTGLTSAAFDGLGASGDDRLQASLATLRALCEATEATALERGTLNGVLATGSFKGADYPSFVRIMAVRGAAVAQVPRTATAARTDALDAALRTPAAVTVAGMEQQALAGFAAEHLPVLPADWWRAASTLVDDLQQVQSGAAAESRERAAELRSDALRALLLDVLLAVTAVLGAVLLGLAATRSITRPLAALAAGAADLADRVLPEAVGRIRDAGPGQDLDDLAALPAPVGAGRAQELAEVAEALDRVSATALRLAVEQSVLQRNSTGSLANLGRRNQALVSRQLGFLSALEREEHDPGVLANLFELDHLATRMRRNAESVLVLAGERSPRRWARPVGTGDVVRAALGEVEDYRRVVLRQVDEAQLDGAAVAEVAHLLAELIENALAASAPDTDVEVYARLGGAGYLVAVVDHGAGMTEAELERANARLGGEESFLVGSTGLLGHYVVGRLAVRLGARVRLTPSPVRGVTATVLLPGGLLASAPQSPQQLQPSEAR
ncbi:ATP-binding protein [Kitasatospora sp. NBC_00240]|uniref:sensor histidine kinase n=1 Tax=Kitasatospora sp. NBC_00240 TaxID=2903567 RepID=UPI0022525874|nr:ATP-binding protein [Kitasatospora sp. NBC_00240]MCX5210893.1 ATP-binding protein [Kitasatospora sp. NBC_00240]